MPEHDTPGLEECLYLTRGRAQAFLGHLLCARPLTHSILVNHYHSSVGKFLMKVGRLRPRRVKELDAGQALARDSLEFDMGLIECTNLSLYCVTNI